MAEVAHEVHPDDPEAIERGRLLFAQPCDFFWAAASLGDLPDAERPEIAFAGRSNVGKSSLINGLTGRNGLARTSNTPGRTQELIFFNLGGRLTLVDLPGYGYAKVSKTKVADWTEMVRGFLRGRPTLARVFLLIDSRHGMKPSDEELMKVLDQAAVSFQVVLTKADKLKPGQIERCIAETAEAAARHVAAHPEVIATSSEKGTGLPLLRAYAAAFAND